MRAMILAAGEGTRIRSVSRNTAKALLPVNGTPLLEHTLLWLSNSSITEVAINLHYLSRQIEEFAGNGDAFGVQVTYSPEEVLLGTAGGVKRMQAFLSDPFLVVYGDVLTDVALKPVESFHEATKASVTMVVCPSNKRQDAGAVQINELGRVIAFSERPAEPEYEYQFMAGGIYIMNKEVLKLVPENEYFDFGHNLFPILTAQGHTVFSYPVRRGEYLLDIGTPERYQRANRDAEAGIIAIMRR